MDSRRCIELVWQTWAQGHGLDPSPIVLAAHGHRTVETLHVLFPQLDAAAEVARLDALEEAEQRGVVTVARAAELVAAIPRARWGVVTSGSAAVARLRLRLGRIPDPPVLVAAGDVREGKPSPEGYLRAATALGHAPHQCLVVEDTPAGIEAGRAGGMTVIAVRGTFPEPALAAADAIVGSVGELRVEQLGAGLTVSWGTA